MAFNAYLIFQEDTQIQGESTSEPKRGVKIKRAIEITDYGFGVSMPVTPSRSDGGGATVGRANFDVFTCSKNIDTATPKLVEYCCKGTDIPAAVLHIFRGGATDKVDPTGVVEYAMVVFHHCVITKVAITGSGEELPKESLEFNYGRCEYVYQETEHTTGAAVGDPRRYGWSTIKNKEAKFLQNWGTWMPEDGSSFDK